MVTTNYKKRKTLQLLLALSLLVILYGIIVSVIGLQEAYEKSLNTEDSFAGIQFPSISVPETQEATETYSSGGGGGGGSSSKKSKEHPLEDLEENYQEFEEIEVQEKTVLFYQRKIGEATVEKDFKVYQLDEDGEEIENTIISWREDLSEELLSNIITQEQAEGIVGGDIRFSRLYIISPDSDIFPIDPTPTNPCWIVATTNEYGYMELTVIDSITGENLGNGIPPPSNAYAVAGPQDFYPCENPFSTSLPQLWLEKMHYDLEAVDIPTKEDIQSHIQSNEDVIFYENAHGDYEHFTSGCTSDGLYGNNTLATDIESWISSYNKKAFTFLATCDAMCETGVGTFSHAFRKGSYEDTTVTGYCGMSTGACFDCWQNSFVWENRFFQYMNGGFDGGGTVYSIKDAFDLAIAYYPMCSECILFEGDEDLGLIECDTEWGDYYCCDWGDDTYTCRNGTCHNLAGVSYTKPYSETPFQKCGESYCEDWSDNHCENGNIYRSRDCYNAGCSEGACYNEYYEDKELIETCEYDCASAQCTFPDLIVEDLIIQNIVGNNVVLAFTIKNIGDAITDSIYWMVDTDSSDTNPERTTPTTLGPDESTRAYMLLNYSSSGTYNPIAMVDFDNLINELNEGNNQESIEVSV